MLENIKYFFKKKNNQKGKVVLTVAATFPSLIQPWLVNQLTQIVINGGENKIVARRSELGVYDSNIDKYGLFKNYRIVPEDKLTLVLTQLCFLLTPNSLYKFLKGLPKYFDLLRSSNFTLKEKFHAFFLIPYMGLDYVDIIHSHSEMAGNKFMPFIVELGVPFVITFHGLPPIGVNKISDAERTRYTQQASIILVNTEFAKRQYISLGASADKIKIIPQGLNLDDFPFKHKPFPDDSAVNILTVGRYHPDKGQRYAIRAIANLIQKGMNIKYRLVGNGPDLDGLISLAADLNISDAIEFYSSVSDEQLQALYSISHIFVLPSLKAKDGFHEETQGVVLQEAQASGLITIATKVGGIPECLDAGVSGFLVNDRSSDEIEDCLTEIISKPDKWVAYQRDGRKWVEDNYDINVIGKKMDTIYNDLLLSSS